MRKNNRLIGKKYNRLTILERTAKRNSCDQFIKYCELVYKYNKGKYNE